MQKRRGLVSHSDPPVTREHAPKYKRRAEKSDSESDLSSSESSGFSSSESESESATKPAEADPAQGSGGFTVGGDAAQETPADRAVNPSSGGGAKKGKGKQKAKPDYSDETRWKKMKLQGSEKDVMVDMTRLQKYVDLDTVGVSSYQDEIKQAKGNFRQQMADYSDL